MEVVAVELAKIVAVVDRKGGTTMMVVVEVAKDSGG